MGLLCLVAVISVSLWHPRSALAADTINFQGKLTNPDGTNVTGGSYSITFTVYDGGTPTGGGTNVWQETQSVTVTDGVFHVDLGSINSTLRTAVNYEHAPLYLGVQVGTDTEMTPRILLSASPYAFDSAQLNGLTSSNFVQLAQGVQTDASTADSIAINKTGASGNIINLQRAGSSVYTIGNDGSVAYTLASGKNLTTNLAAGSQAIYQATASQTQDLISVTNTGHEPSVSDANGLHVNYGGGSAGGIDGAGMRVDYAPGSGSGSEWSGVRIVANATGAGSGVTSYGLRLDGPTSSGAGQNTAIKIADGWDIGLDIGSGGLQLANQSNPTPPAAGQLKVYAKTVNGRQMLKVIGPSGINYPLQPSLFQNQVAIINVQSGTTSNYFGTNRSVTGTAVAAAFDEDFGYMASYSTGTTTNTSAGIGNNGTQFARGSKVGANGYFSNVRGAVQDASYTAARIFVGMTDQTVANSVKNQNSNGNRSGFSYDTGRGDSNWQFSTKDGTTENLVDTGLPFIPAAAYDWYIYVPSYPNNTTVYWRIDNLTAGTSQEGATTQNLPDGATAMRMSVAIRNLSATNQTISYQRIYVESDR